MPTLAKHAQLHFGPFEVDTTAGELSKHGIHIKLHAKPFQILLALLEHPGEVVTRKELQERLWPEGTFVEFENALNNVVSRLRESLGDEAEKSRFIETVPRRGYRFLPKVTRALPLSRTVLFRRRLLVVGVVLGAALVIGAVSHFAFSRKQPIHSLAVLPFRNVGAGTASSSFAAGMTDVVTTELAKLSVSKVVSETSVAQFKNTKESVPEIAHILGVDGIVEGAVDQHGNEVRITVQLIRAGTDQDVWADSYDRQMTDILAIQDEVGLGVAREIKFKLSPTSQVGPLRRNR